MIVTGQSNTWWAFIFTTAEACQGSEAEAGLRPHHARTMAEAEQTALESIPGGWSPAWHGEDVDRLLPQILGTLSGGEDEGPTRIDWPVTIIDHQRLSITRPCNTPHG